MIFPNCRYTVKGSILSQKVTQAEVQRRLLLTTRLLEATSLSTSWEENPLRAKDFDPSLATRHFCKEVPVGTESWGN